MFRRRSRSRRGGSRRRMQWGRGDLVSSVPGTVTVGDTLPATFWYKVPAGVPKAITGGVDLEPEDWTLVRSILSFQASFVPTTAGAVFAEVGAGLIVWEGTSEEDPNPLEVPLPIGDGDADWLWHFAAVAAQPATGSGAPVFLVDNHENSFDVQSRAMRKLSARQGLLFVCELSNFFGEQDLGQFLFGFFGRSLFKLP